MGKAEKKVLNLPSRSSIKIAIHYRWLLLLPRYVTNIFNVIIGSKGRGRQLYYAKHGASQVTNRIARV